MQGEFKSEMSRQIAELIGYHLDKNHIYSDNPGYHYYIRMLKSKHPLLIMHYRGFLMAVIPDIDYQQLGRVNTTQTTYSML